MTKNLYLQLFTLIIGVHLTSCVTRKKFDDLNLRKSSLETDKAACDELLKTTTADKEKLTAEFTALSKDNNILKKDTLETGIYLRKTLSNYKDLNDTYDKLLKNGDRLQANSATEKRPGYKGSKSQ